MNKGTRLTKRMVALFLVLLLGIESFGAVVSDNDGSAFITKAEFDSLKNSFQAQIDQYNTSIDSKIDGAIASYLAGISVSKQETSPILISNYEDMKWVRNLYLYGKWHKWSGQTTKTGSDTNVWYKPNLNEKRISLRSNNITVWDTWATAMQFGTNRLNFNITAATNGITVGDGAWHWSATEPVAPQLAIVYKRHSDGHWSVNTSTPLRNEYTYGPYLLAGPHAADDNTVVAIGTQAQYEMAWYYDVGINNVALNNDANRILSYDVAYQHPSLANPAFRFYLTKDNCDWPVIWDRSEPDDAGKFASQTTSETAWSVSRTSSWAVKGVTWHVCDSSSYASKQKPTIKYMMFGRDNDDKANIEKETGSTGERKILDVEGSDDTGEVTVNFTDFYYAAPVGGSSASKAFSVTGKKLRIPHLPSEYLRNMTTEQYLYNSTYLKWGQGMPLKINSTSNGYLQVSFDYDVKKILDDTPESTTSKKIILDIKKSDFLSSETEYAKGYKELVDPESTSSTEIVLKDCTYETTNGKCGLTIPVKKDDSFWLRLAPNSTTYGLYAQIKNLKFKMFIQ